ncbi:MAG: mandelate racemase, partial [Planctomycetes bacterium]|nr:mandelate racemase [Planctomycetota bacterium]
MKIQSYDLHRLHLQLPCPIGDSQVRFTDHWMTLLELKTDEGVVGIGFELQQGTPTAGRDELCAQFEHATWPALHGAHAVGRALHISRPRGGNVGAGVLSLATETALWDLTAKAHSLSLFRLLGGTEPRVRAYASTLDFHLGDEEFKVRLGEFKEMGFSSVKIKVGHPDVDWDLRRMQMAKDVMGDDGDLMVDANEAWSPKEALLRLHTYENAGFEVFWVEDPITREDYDGYAMLTQELPFTRINTGEYLGFSGKRRLLECGGVDVLNLHGEINAARAV